GVLGKSLQNCFSDIKAGYESHAAMIDRALFEKAGGTGWSILQQLVLGAPRVGAGWIGGTEYGNGGHTARRRNVHRATVIGDEYGQSADKSGELAKVYLFAKAYNGSGCGCLQCIIEFNFAG